MVDPNRGKRPPEGSSRLFLCLFFPASQPSAGKQLGSAQAGTTGQRKNMAKRRVGFAALDPPDVIPMHAAPLRKILLG